MVVRGVLDVLGDVLFAPPSVESTPFSADLAMDAVATGIRRERAGVDEVPGFGAAAAPVLKEDAADLGAEALAARVDDAVFAVDEAGAVLALRAVAALAVEEAVADLAVEVVFGFEGGDFLLAAGWSCEDFSLCPDVDRDKPPLGMCPSNA